MVHCLFMLPAVVISQAVVVFVQNFCAYCHACFSYRWTVLYYIWKVNASSKAISRVMHVLLYVNSYYVLWWWQGNQFNASRKCMFDEQAVSLRCLTPYLVSSRSYFFHIKKLRRISTACSCLLELGCLFTHCASSRVCPIAHGFWYCQYNLLPLCRMTGIYIWAAIMCVKSSCFANFQNYQKFGMCWYPFLLQNQKGPNFICIISSQPSRENVSLKHVGPGK